MWEVVLCTQDGRELFRRSFRYQDEARKEANRLLAIRPDADYAALHFRTIFTGTRHFREVIRRDQEAP